MGSSSSTITSGSIIVIRSFTSQNRYVCAHTDLWLSADHPSSKEIKTRFICRIHSGNYSFESSAFSGRYLQIDENGEVNCKGISTSPYIYFNAKVVSTAWALESVEHKSKDHKFRYVGFTRDGDARAFKKSYDACLFYEVIGRPTVIAQQPYYQTSTQPMASSPIIVTSSGCSSCRSASVPTPNATIVYTDTGCRCRRHRHHCNSLFGCSCSRCCGSSSSSSSSVVYPASNSPAGTPTIVYASRDGSCVQQSRMVHPNVMVIDQPSRRRFRGENSIVIISSPAPAPPPQPQTHYYAPGMHSQYYEHSPPGAQFVPPPTYHDPNQFFGSQKYSPRT